MARRKSAKASTTTSKPPTVTGKRKRPEVQMKECVICVETKPIYRNFPAFTTCSHDPDTCLSCIAKQTVILLQDSGGKGWSACTCPQCNVAVPTQELQGALPRALVKEMKEMVDKAHRSTDDSWRWCLASGCGHGSLQDGQKEMIRCRKCDYKMCFKHQVPWHRGYTCHDYETSHPQAAITKTNEEMISKMSKPCPGCGIAVEKVGGCNHMNCGQCGSSWLWDNPAAGSLTLTGQGVPGPLQRVGFREDEDGDEEEDDGDAQPQTAIRPLALNNPAVQRALVPVPTLEFWRRQIVQQAEVERERIRELVEAHQSAAPPDQSRRWVPGEIMFRPLLPPPMPTPLWTFPNGNFQGLPSAGETTQTAIDLTGEDDRRNQLRGRRRSR